MPTVIPVKFPYSSHDLWFDPAGSGAEGGDHVVCKTERGTEFGLATADPFEAPEEELAAPLKPVLRVATDEDVEFAEGLADQGDAAMYDFRRLIEKNKLDMKPVAVEYLFGGEKAVFYFAAEDRVDFRQLVKDLSSFFRMRVDMRQIGVRDETRLVGGYAQCGQELCCTRFGGQFEPVSIRMAKEQDLPLNSSKISGVCGRLMCCLRYEFEAYKDFKSRAPKKKAVIQTPLGKAKIVEYDTPQERLKLRLENGKSFTVDLASMTCSPEACKRSEEQGCVCRPDTVTRETLDAIESPDIALALLELDRKNGVAPEPAGLSSSDRIETSSPTPRRRRARDERSREEADKRDASRAPRRRRAAHAEAGAADAASTEQGTRQRRRRRHLSSADRDQAFLDAAAKDAAKGGKGEGAAGNGGKGAAPKAASEKGSAKRAERARGGEAAPADGKVPDARPGRSRRRRHKPAAEAGQQAPRTAGSKPDVPSVAEQVSTGEVKVRRRRVGDRGGDYAEARSNARSVAGAPDEGRSEGGRADAARAEGGRRSADQRRSQQADRGGDAAAGDQRPERRKRRRRRRPGGSGADAGGSAGAEGGERS